MDFELNGQEYITMDNLLKVLGLVETGGEAHIRIVDGEVTFNGSTEYQKRKKIRQGDVVTYNGHTIKVK
ncbi:RNA-binding S4 domain-containing protein [soil metagenome]